MNIKYHELFNDHFLFFKSFSIYLVAVLTIKCLGIIVKINGGVAQLVRAEES